MKIIILSALLLAGCNAAGAPDIARIERDVEIACHAWAVAKQAAIIAGIFVPGVSSGAIIIGAAVEPVCDGRALAALRDPSTAQWIAENTEELHQLVKLKRNSDPMPVHG